MRKLYSAAFASTFFFFGSPIPKATFAAEVSTATTDLGYFVSSENTGSETQVHLYKLASDGAASVIISNIFPDSTTNSFSATDYTVDQQKGKIYFLEPPRSGISQRRIRVFDMDTNAFEGFTNITNLPGSGSPMFIDIPVKMENLADKKCNTTSTSCGATDTKFISLGGEGTDELLRIDNDGISQGGSTGKSLVKYVGNELHIGENSWITKEEDGRQKVYAKDAAGNPIPIDYTNGTKLLINGRDVEQAIDNVGALTAALTGLPTIPPDTPLACGVGAGVHSGSNALSGGCARKVNERLTFNAAASFIPAKQEYQGTDNSWSGRAGFVFKLGKINKPTLISMKEKKALQTKVESLTSKNKSIEDKNKELENRLALQNERLEKLEQIALGLTNSTDLASIAP